MSEQSSEVSYIHSQKGAKILVHQGHQYVLQNKVKTGREYWRCRNGKNSGGCPCPGRLLLSPDGVPTLSQPHLQEEEEDKDRVNLTLQKEVANERLKELVIQAEDGDRTIDIIRRWLKELSADVRALMPDEISLTRKVRRWANAGGVELPPTTFEDYLVEDGLEDIIPPPAAAPSSLLPADVKPNVNVVGTGTTSSKPELIFLKGRSGEKLRVMIGENVYTWNKDLERGGSVYRCQEVRVGCRVTVKISLEDKQYEVRGEHRHQKKVSGDQDLALAAGEGQMGYDNSASFFESPRPPTPPFLNDIGGADGGMLEDSNICDDDDGGDADFCMDDFQESVPEMEQTTANKKSTKPRTVLTSSTVQSNLKKTRKDAVKSGEKCFVCGDDLIVSEALSSSEETFRKACSYLNVRSEGDWFPNKRSNGQFYSFCESCTNEVSRIHQLYRKVEEIQSLIFQKVETVEKRVADAEIIWMAEAPPSFAKRFEGFRNQVLINYRNKLKLRREIRVGAKLGHRFIEIQPSSTAQMFASDPSEPIEFRKVAPTNAVEKDTGLHSAERPPTAKSSRSVGRPKRSRKKEVSPPPPHENKSLEEDTNAAIDDFSGFEDAHDDSVSNVGFEREMKFWEEDPGRLNLDSINANSPSPYADGGDSDPDYEGNNDDDDWLAPKRGRSAKSTRRSKRQPPGKTKQEHSTAKIKTWAEKFREARAARLARSKNNPPPTAAKQTKKGSQSAKQPKKKKFPDLDRTRDGRVFLSGHEIIKNPPGLNQRHPYSISFSCGTCAKIQQTLWKVKDHIMGHHLGMYNCTICGKQYTDTKTLKIHNELNHSERAGIPNPCPVCGRPISGRTEQMRYHRWTHLSDREKQDPQYKSYCPPHKRDPNRVKSSHGLQTFMCSFCPKSYFHPSALKRHELIHSSGQDSSIQCHFCGKMLKSRKTMNEHRRICKEKRDGGGADDVKPFLDLPCPKCPVRFKNRATRNKHVRKFHKSGRTDSYQPFSCPKCSEETFRTKEELKVHRRRCSGKKTVVSDNNPSASSSSSANNVSLFGGAGYNLFGNPDGYAYHHHQPYQSHE